MGTRRRNYNDSLKNLLLSRMNIKRENSSTDFLNNSKLYLIDVRNGGWRLWRDLWLIRLYALLETTRPLGDDKMHARPQVLLNHCYKQPLVVKPIWSVKPTFRRWSGGTLVRHIRMAAFHIQTHTLLTREIWTIWRTQQLNCVKIIQQPL